MQRAQVASQPHLSPDTRPQGDRNALYFLHGILMGDEKSRDSKLLFKNFDN
jgi:hypothetical protein